LASHVFIDGSKIVGNSSSNGNGYNCYGGGLNVYNATISNSLISEKSTCSSGGGIYADNQLTISDSTIVNNHVGGVEGYTYGVGILPKHLILRNSTITNNLADDQVARGAGVEARTLDIANSIVAGNVARGGSPRDPDISGTIILSNGHNVFGSDVAGNVPGDRENIAGSALFAAVDPVTGGGKLGPDGTVPLRNNVANPALRARPERSAAI
jgi:hypothetical protein